MVILDSLNVENDFCIYLLNFLFYVNFLHKILLTLTQKYRSNEILFNTYFLQALGKTGKVLKIYSDGDLRVAVAGHTWTFNAASVTSVPGSIHEINNTMRANDESQEHTSMWECDIHNYLAISYSFSCCVL